MLPPGRDSTGRGRHDEDSPGHRRRFGNRPPRGAGAASGRLRRGHLRPKGRNAAGDGFPGGFRKRRHQAYSMRRLRSASRRGHVPGDRDRLRPARSVVQQCRREYAVDRFRRPVLRAVEAGDRREPDRGLSLRPARVRSHASPGPPGRSHRQQRLDLGARSSSGVGTLHGVETCDHRADQIDFARRPGSRHRLRPDRHRQRADAADGEDGEGCAAGRRPASRRRTRWTWSTRRTRGFDGRASPCRQHPVHDHHGDEHSFIGRG